MRGYQVRFLPEAADEFASLDKPIAERVLKKLKWLAENFENLPNALAWRVERPLQAPCRKLQGALSFDWGKRTIYVHLIGHRQEIYKLP